MGPLPQWLIAKKAGYCAGRRLPKWHKFEEPKSIVPFTGSYYNRIPAVYQEHTKNGDDHRFWAIDDCGTWECRACQTPLWLEADRKIHLANEGCAKKLVAAYELLKRDMRCVICDEHCTMTRWGVPMCIKGNCVERWLEEAQPMALTYALGLASITGTGKYVRL